MSYRNRALLDLSRRIGCTLRRPGCQVEPTGPCHSNWQIHGKGKGIKADDLFHCAGCDHCHRWLDSGPAPREEKEASFRKAMDETMLAYWSNGLVCVAGPGSHENRTGDK